jgi:hypothetical protein
MQVNFAGEALSERAFLLMQLYTHMFSELKRLERPDVFERISLGFVTNFFMPIGHELGNKFYSFLLSGGIRGNPDSGIGKEEMVPVTDFLLLHGRAGLIAIFMAHLDLNLAELEALEKKGDYGSASKLFADPYATGSKCSVESLIDKASEYLLVEVGTLSFHRAVAIIDSFATKLLAPLKMM